MRVRVRIGLDESHSPVVLLEERDGPRVLPIWIGPAEAGSIASQIQPTPPPPRPNYHDLARSVIEQLDARIERLVVTELRDQTYYGVLYLETHDGRIEVDVRPSDGIAIALRAEAPILVRASLFDEASEVIEGDEPGRAIEWRQRERELPATDALTF